MMKDDRKTYGAVRAARSQEDPGLIGGLSTKAFLLILGLFVLGMLVLIPCWSAIKMLTDTIILQFLGSSLPKALLYSSLGVILLFMVSTLMFFRCARTEALNEQTFFMIGNIFLVLLGTVLVLISMPLGVKARDISLSLFNECELGSATGSLELYKTSQVLQALRAQPDCMAKISIEDCHGYRATPYTAVLKAMEFKLHCSGFCYNPEGINVTTMIIAQAVAAEGNSTDADGKLAPRPAFLQVGSADARAEQAVVAAPMAARAVAIVAAAGGGASANAAVQREKGGSAVALQAARGIFLPYPPTLFSNANYQASCDGMSARHIQYSPGEVSVQLFYEGIFLTFTSLFVGLLKLCGMCLKDRTVRKPIAHVA